MPVKRAVRGATAVYKVPHQKVYLYPKVMFKLLKTEVQKVYMLFKKKKKKVGKFEKPNEIKITPNSTMP